MDQPQVRDEEYPSLNLETVSDQFAQGSVINKNFSDILTKFVQVPDYNAFTAAKQIDDLVPKHQTPSGTPLWQIYLPAFWMALINIAKQIHYKHPAHERIVQVVQELCALSPSQSSGETEARQYGQVKSLPSELSRNVWKQPGKDGFGLYGIEKDNQWFGKHL